MNSRALVANLVAFATILASSTLVPNAEAADPVAIGEVTSQVARVDMDVEAVMRSALMQEIPRLRVRASQKKKHAVISVALTRLDTMSTPSGIVDTCKVIATLRDARGGAIFAVLEGGASGNHTSRPAEEIVRSAVQGLVVRIPEAMH